MMSKSFVFSLTLTSLLFTARDVGAWQDMGVGSGPGAGPAGLGAIFGLRRITTPDEDLKLDLFSTSSVQEGLQFTDHVWPLSELEDTFAYGQLDTAAVADGGRSENHMEHSILALPAEITVLDLPGVGGVSSAYHSIQLQSAGLDQGYVEVTGGATGDVATTWSTSASHTTAQGGFPVLVDPVLDLTEMPDTYLTVESSFWLHLEGLPLGSLEDGALLRKEIGASYVQAIYSRSSNTWEISGFMAGEEDPFLLYTHGQDLSFRAGSVQVVGEGETLYVSEITDYCVVSSANDGPGPDQMMMQFSAINSGTGKLFLREFR